MSGIILTRRVRNSVVAIRSSSDYSRVPHSSQPHRDEWECKPPNSESLQLSTYHRSHPPQKTRHLGRRRRSCRRSGETPVFAQWSEAADPSITVNTPVLSQRSGLASAPVAVNTPVFAFALSPTAKLVQFCPKRPTHETNPPPRALLLAALSTTTALPTLHPVVHFTKLDGYKATSDSVTRKDGSSPNLTPIALPPHQLQSNQDTRNQSPDPSPDQVRTKSGPKVPVSKTLST